MNESIFFGHIVVIAASIGLFFRLGKIPTIGFLSLLVIASNLFVLKQVRMFGLDVCCSDAYAVGYLFAVNLMQEFSQREAVKTTLYVSIWLQIAFSIFSRIHLLYTPSPIDTTHAAFSTICSPMPRLALASLLTFLIVQRIDMALFSSLRKKMAGRHFTGCLLLTLLVTELIDTALFTLLGLWGQVHELGSVFLFSLLAKWATVLLTLPWGFLMKQWFRQGLSHWTPQTPSTS